MRFRSVAIWKQAIVFHLAHWNNFLPILPLLFIPVFTDALHSLLIKQDIERREFFPLQAVKEVWRLVPSLLGMKLYFESAALLWGFIPIYGIIRGVKHRMYWSMASNVLVFEGLSGKAGRQRCRELVKGFLGGIGIRTLITIPALLITVLLIAFVIGATFVETNRSYGFWIFIALVFWISIPGSAAVNTFLYTDIVKVEKGINP
jgi:hypothetical protein